MTKSQVEMDAIAIRNGMIPLFAKHGIEGPMLSSLLSLVEQICKHSNRALLAWCEKNKFDDDHLYRELVELDKIKEYFGEG